MSLDFDPKKNREQFEKLRRFSAGSMLIFKPWFYYFLGCVAFLSGLLVLFSQEGQFVSPGGDLSQRQYGLLLIFAGVLIALVCKLAQYYILKISEYRPRDTGSDDWNS